MLIRRASRPFGFIGFPSHPSTWYVGIGVAADTPVGTVVARDPKALASFERPSRRRLPILRTRDLNLEVDELGESSPVPDIEDSEKLAASSPRLDALPENPTAPLRILCAEVEESEEIVVVNDVVLVAESIDPRTAGRLDEKPRLETPHVLVEVAEAMDSRDLVNMNGKKPPGANEGSGSPDFGASAVVAVGLASEPTVDGEPNGGLVRTVGRGGKWGIL
ncbi:hypothetical protein FA13DRAFT_1727661 [Coprinellus micaceus]|uniref:Uncharacterized protein n=1 Tax=Coprinellus micaceus TaxID=71717 RepID=A0A4Y7TPH9_COPMI|nr:hypothetical protein FA13DRAFT_1727661 [Coprinellus micaceus]